MKLYIDDIRYAPDESWTVIRTITEAIRCIAFWGNEITEISLDHDISAEVRVNGVYRPFPTDETFAAVAYFIAEKWWRDKAMEGMMTQEGLHIARTITVPKITIHSANIVGCEAMALIIGRAGIPYEIKPMGQAHRKK